MGSRRRWMGCAPSIRPPKPRYPKHVRIASMTRPRTSLARSWRRATRWYEPIPRLGASLCMSILDTPLDLMAGPRKRVLACWITSFVTRSNRSTPAVSAGSQARLRSGITVVHCIILSTIITDTSACCIASRFKAIRQFDLYSTYPARWIAWQGICRLSLVWAIP